MGLQDVSLGQLAGLAASGHSGMLDTSTPNETEDTSIRAAAKCDTADIPCVLDGLYPDRDRQGGSPIRCKDVRGFFEVMDAAEEIRIMTGQGYSAYGPNAKAIFPNGKTYRDLEPCADACDTNNFQNCRIVTPPKRSSSKRGADALERKIVYTSEQAGTLSSDAAADQKDKQREDSRFLTSSAAYDFEKYRIKRTPAPLSIQTALIYGAIGVAAAYIIKKRKG